MRDVADLVEFSQAQRLLLEASVDGRNRRVGAEELQASFSALEKIDGQLGTKQVSVLVQASPDAELVTWLSGALRSKPGR